MKRTRTFFLAAIAVLVGLLAATPGWTGHGNHGSGDGTCHLNIIPEGTPTDISGTVYAAATWGGGLQVDTETEIVTIYGLGPVWYWERADIERPAVGEPITVSAVEVTFSDGTTRLIAIAVTIEGATIDLRDPDTGTPLWRMPRIGRRGGPRN